MTNRVHIYVDESGSLPNPYDPIVTMAAVRTDNPHPLRWLTRRAMRDIRWRSPKHAGTSEFKFNTTTERAKVAVLAALAKEDVALFASSIYKGPQRIADTPENYGIVLCSLLEMCIAKGEEVELVVDSHFTRPKKRDELNRLVQATLYLNTVPRYVDSKKNPYVQLADFVAGAVFYKRVGREAIFYEFIRERFISDQLRSWKDLKREWYERQRQ